MSGVNHFQDSDCDFREACAKISCRRHRECKLQSVLKQKATVLPEPEYITTRTRHRRDSLGLDWRRGFLNPKFLGDTPAGGKAEVQVEEGLPLPLREAACKILYGGGGVRISPGYDRLSPFARARLVLRVEFSGIEFIRDEGREGREC